MSEPEVIVADGDPARNALDVVNDAQYRKYVRFVVAALSSVPWVGGLLGASASLHAEFDQGKTNVLFEQWLAEHQRRLTELAQSLQSVTARLDQLGDEATNRVESEQYLALVRKGYRTWDQADTDAKKKLVENILGNAGATSLTSDDVVRLFLEWIDHYHEAHFAVIREVYKNPGSTRQDIWDGVHGTDVREDSAEADLFRLLIHDLSTGRVVRQHRDTTASGQFIRKKSRPKGSTGRVMTSAFDDKEPYELTELGKQFVHYAMNEVVPRVAAAGAQSLSGDK